MSSSPLDHKLKIDTEEAQKRAIKNVARMLQRPDQLEKVDQFHKEFERKRMGNESRLKTAVQSQLEGVKTGIEQLSLALRNVREVKTRMRLVFNKIFLLQFDPFQAQHVLARLFNRARESERVACFLIQTAYNIENQFLVKSKI